MYVRIAIICIFVCIVIRCLVNACVYESRMCAYDCLYWHYTCVLVSCLVQAYPGEIEGIRVEWRYVSNKNWCVKRNYPLVNYTQFANTVEMMLNAHTIEGMYSDYDYVKVVVLFLETYTPKTYCDVDKITVLWVVILTQ